jgi:hypothetical protein
MKNENPMKSIYRSVIIIILALLHTTIVSGQCKEFAKKSCKPLLKPYWHDGNYNVAVLSEGEKAELYKTFYTGQEYRIAICAEKSLVGVEFVIKNENREVLYSNRDNDFSPTWDFSIDGTQQIIISIKVLEDNDDNVKMKGCVAIMFGLKE